MTKYNVIPKNIVMEAYLQVKRNGGSAGADGVSLDLFKNSLKNELYKIWNRLSSGCYFPPPVLAVPIEKKDGGKRILGIPSVADRVAQTVVKTILEPRFEQIFHSSSFGYRPHKSAHEAVMQARNNCWKSHWTIDLDIKGFFDNLDHGLLMKAVEKHVPEKWIRQIISRWLKAPMQLSDRQLIERTKGTPQGGVISPLLANVFLHYAFDHWMQTNFPQIPFERYADDIVVHCKTEKQAEYILKRITDRLRDCRLEVHPVKTKIVRCYSKSKGNIGQFDFLGFTFRPRKALNANGQVFANFLPSISRDAVVSIKAEIRRWKIHLWSRSSIDKIAEEINPKVRGWIQYYGEFYRTDVVKLLWFLEQALTRWVMRKYRTLKGRPTNAGRFLGKIAKEKPNLFAHWVIGAHSYAE